MHRLITFLIIACTAWGTQAQNVSLKDGLYQTFEDFRHARCIPLERIISSSPQDDLQFLNKEMTRKFIKYKDDRDSVREVKSSSMWGYVSNGSLFVNHNSAFNRVPVVGSLAHFTAIVETYQGPANPYHTVGEPMYTREMRQYVLKLADGMILEFTPGNMIHMMQDDPAMLESFSQLKRSQQRKLMFMYLRQYNEAHPWEGQQPQ
ncbi:MAG: hypothetical protein H6585_11145 [Flavobacteriales bacterium]|nr:hypothetical protein [Flavobacteriales bacterium]MCB9448890.1 hypothetical protein [Flavobacteriales bacterium]